MILRVGIENNNDDRSIAWALEHPGCFAYGPSAEEAAANMQAAAGAYAAWVAAHGMSWFPQEPLEVQVEETFDVYFVPREDGSRLMIESFFRCDRDPLSATDIQRALQLLDWSRQDLLSVLQPLTVEQRTRVLPGERWSIDGILKHICGAEWWYQERIGSAFPAVEDDLPAEPRDCLDLTRAHFLALLPELEAVEHAIELEGEMWSPRKVLRRALWHERDHTDHIRKLI